jgi:hypothetical protein
MTLLLMHSPLEAGESLYVALEPCIHASEGIQVHVGMIEFFLL